MSAHEWSNAQYSGSVDNGWYSGTGAYTFKNGTVYEGDFVKGHFHGKGVLRFPEGRLEGEFAFGRAVDVKFIFADGLGYERNSWKYLSPHDRRFFREHTEGIAPAGATALSNEAVLPEIPVGTFDAGDGYLAPGQSEIIDYSGERIVRSVAAEEVEWILSHCRQGVSDARRAKQNNEKIANVLVDCIVANMSLRFCVCEDGNIFMFALLLSLLLSGVTAATGTVVGEIQTCSGCRLNRLHDVRKFVYDEAKKYESLSVKFIGGHNPDLVIFDSPEKKTELARIDLSPFSLVQLHEVVAARGFALKPSFQPEL